MIHLLYLVIFGFSLTAVFGLLASGIDRIVTARVQYRTGPPIIQPFIDIVKLLGKENLVPIGVSKLMFFGAPLIGFASVVLVSTFLWINNFNPNQSFGGDLIVVLYLLIIPSISVMMGGFASRNPLASLGSSREMKLILSYELPFILAVMVPVIKSGYSIRLGDIINSQAQSGMVLMSMSGLLAMVVAVLSVQAKLGLVPFDMAEAETEIVSGPLIEYSGAGLALFRLMKNMLLFVLPFLLVILYLGGAQVTGIQFLWSILKFVGVLVLITLIRNTNPRVRIDQAIRFFWSHLTILSVIAVILALVGF
ncbi:MAG: NADH-quinone oxidoreductase subunit H [Elusimicrobia bacterium]|nr:NADH-quinone oxidoreductase subunit H [Candidatus Obscuribacterium magneticum]